MELKLKSLWQIFSKERRYGRKEQFFINKKKKYNRQKDKKVYERDIEQTNS